MNQIKFALLKLFTLLFLVTTNAYALTTVNDLIQDDKLKVELFLSVAGQQKRSVTLPRPAVVNEQIDLIIKVSTDRWFTRGTRVIPLNLNGALVQQRDKLASNYTQRIDGQTWSVQEWQLAIYPVEAGRFEIPYVTLAASVSLEEGGSAQGYLETPSLGFDVVTPAPTAMALSSDAPFAATKVVLTQNWSASSDLKVGDVIERNLFIDADETTISLLPTFELAELTGSKGYREVSNVLDIQQRGRYSAKKEVTHTYIVQQSGTLQIPEINIDWWNTESATMQQVTLPGLEVNITHTPQSWLTQYWGHLLLSFAALGGIVLLICHLRQRYQHERLPTVIFFVRQLLAKNWQQANRHLYNRNHEKNDQLLLREQVAKQDVDSWSKQHFSPEPVDNKPKIINLLRMWLAVNRRKP